ncbi:hypothetical protein DOY81_010652 [Sarcophaga bullata]|nr:hypothetical protein DOY81_010652 [Sarcophaga bullata]
MTGQVVWCLGIYFALAICVYDEYTESNIDLPTTQKPLYFSEYLVYLFHLLELIRLINVRGGIIFWKFQYFIIDFDRDLLNFNLKCDYNDLKRFLRQHMGLIVLHIICTIIIGYFYSHGILISFARTNTVYVLPNIIINISLIQYYALLFMIYKRSEKLCGLVEHHLNNPCTLDTWNCRLQLHYIRSLYAKLEEFTQLVNNQFSISILLVYLGSSINLSVNIFYSTTWDTSDWAWIAYSLDWACMHVGKMFLILYYNQKIQNMKNCSVTVLSSFKFEHHAIETTLRLFILQLASDTRSNVICGLAALNMNFITSLLVAISTLFIFLVQYDITLEALTKTHNSGRPKLNFH